MTVPCTLRWTVEDYHRAIDAGLFDDRRIELIDGELYEMPPIGEPHVGAVRYLLRTFSPLLQADRLLVSMPIILPRDGEPEPDLAVVRAGAPLKPLVSDVQLAIEVSHSTRQFDRGPKLEAYLRDALRELWIVDLEKRELLVYRDGQLVALLVPGQGAGISASHVPEISVDVDALFAAATPPDTR
jgi:Uma2 family endonuclease